MLGVEEDHGNKISTQRARAVMFRLRSSASRYFIVYLLLNAVEAVSFFTKPKSLAGDMFLPLKL
jgi:hypothetical protein